MDEQPGLSDQYRKVSAWPLFIALGLPIAEIGVLFGLVPVAVGGLLLFVGSVTGIVQEAGYVDRPWNLLAGFGALLVAIGLVLVVTQVTTLSAVTSGTIASNGIALRGASIVVAGVIAFASGGVGRVLEAEPV